MAVPSSPMNVWPLLVVVLVEEPQFMKYSTWEEQEQVEVNNKRGSKICK